MRRLLLLWRVGRQDLRLLWFALRHPRRPPWLLPLALLLGAFALEPANFAIPLLGAVDDLVLLPLLLHALLQQLPTEVRAGFRGRARRRHRCLVGGTQTLVNDSFWPIGAMSHIRIEVTGPGLRLCCGPIPIMGALYRRVAT